MAPTYKVWVYLPTDRGKPGLDWTDTQVLYSIEETWEINAVSFIFILE